MATTISGTYQKLLSDGILNEDSGQAKVVATLEVCLQEIKAGIDASSTGAKGGIVSFDGLRTRLKSLWSRCLKLSAHTATNSNHISPSGVSGYYLWGGVGRGKTMLMEILIEHLPKDIVWRVHFNELMDFIHAELTKFNKQSNPLKLVAQSINSKCKVLCLDEFFVEDIADAMILGRLLKILIEEHSVYLCATSNTPPDNLYEGGLQRERFLPAIKMLNTHCRVEEILSGDDWRLMGNSQTDNWALMPQRRKARLLMQQKMLQHFSCQDTSSTPMGSVIENPNTQNKEAENEFRESEINVRGRILHGYKIGDGVWFEFERLLAIPTGYRDYIVLCQEFSAIGIRGVPQFNTKIDSEARRFISLIDQAYERRTTMFFTADTEPEDLYIGKLLTHPFKRTISRLQEMRQDSWTNDTPNDTPKDA